MPAKKNATPPKKNNAKPDPVKAAKKQKDTADKHYDAAQREVIYPTVDIKLLTDDKALHEQLAKDLIGWEEVPENVQFDLIDLEGKRVRLNNNLINRSINRARIDDLQQSILSVHPVKEAGGNPVRVWQLNYEPIIISRTGQVLNGQKQLIALVFACQEFRKNPDKYPYFKAPPTIDKMVVFGSREEDYITNTMDTCQQRSLSDVLYRSAWFRSADPKLRHIYSKIASFAIRFCWMRIGIEDAFSVRKTNDEYCHFLDQHDSLCKSVKWVAEENREGSKITKLVGSPGYAAGLLYLMCVSKSDPKVYRDAAVPGESVLDLSNWDAAETFWAELLDKDHKLGKVVRKAMESCRTEDGDETPSRERIAIVIKAWLLWIAKKPVTENALTLEYVQRDTGRELVDDDTVGGIDNGRKHVKPEPDPDQQQIEDRADAVKDRKKMKPPKIGQKVTVLDADGGEWYGRLTDVYEADGKQIAKVEEAGSKKVFETPYENCTQLKGDVK